MNKKLSGVAIWLMAFFLVGGITIFQEYFREHLYYFDMMASLDNWLLLIWAMVAAMVPVGYVQRSDKPTAKGLVWTILISIIVFGYMFIGTKDEFLGSAFLALPVNLGLMMGGFGLALGGMWSGGSMIYRRLYYQEAGTLDRSITALILGFVATLIVSWLLVMTTLLYQIVVVLVLVVAGYLIWRERAFWKTLSHNTSDLIRTHLGFSTWSKTITTVLFALTIMYIAYGLMLAYIPYPTARDANHAYMYFPKVWAEHHGYLWNSIGAHFSPSPWLTYVAVWFQFGYAFQSIGGWIQPDTWAVVQNFFITIVVMILTWGLVRRTIHYFQLRDQSALYQSAWVIILSWMTSGMGAFLVFVDNKSDFGILALTLSVLILAIDRLPGQSQNEEQANGLKSGTLANPYERTAFNFQPIVSGLVAGVAVYSKPTSLFDFTSIVVLVAGLLAGIWAMIGVGLIVIGMMAMMKITTVPLYLDSIGGIICIGIGLLLLIYAIVRKFSQGSISPSWKQGGSSLVVWGAILIAFLVIIKTPIILWRNHITGYELGGAKGYIQSVLMGYNDTQDKTSSDKKQIALASQTLIAQTTNTLPVQSCTLSTEGLTQETLYDGLSKATTEGAGEDLGRYIGYGAKVFTSRWRDVVVPAQSCIGLDHDARVLCRAADAVEKGNFEGLDVSLRGNALELFAQAEQDRQNGISASYIQQNLARQLTLYRQDKVITKMGEEVYVPYRWIVPLNITYNWSLQNLSSYYTDIGVVWLLLLVVLVTATVWLLVYDRRRVIVPLTAIIAWVIWWISGSAILWYGIGLIIWTMLSMIVVYDSWTSSEIKPLSRQLLGYSLVLLGLIVLIQFILNFIRIGSQGGGGIFVQYKTSNGLVQEIDEQLTPVVKNKYGLAGDDIFNLQFPHYNKTIRAIDADKGSKNAVLIAGTYMPYFIYNQYNIISDGFLMSLWEWMSDDNTCRGYLRLKDKNLTYLVIDPNIASVAMGDGNATLRDRMFAKIDPTTGKIVQHGAMSSLANLVSSGYIELFNTNNIAAKYAFILSDEEIKTVFGVADEDIALTRTKVATARFWAEEGNTLLTKVLQLLSQRMVGPQGMDDLADIFGKDVDVPKLAALVQQISSPTIVEQIKTLNQDERFVLANYLSIVNGAKANPEQFQQQILQLLQQSIGGGSQLIVFKVK